MSKPEGLSDSTSSNDSGISNRKDGDDKMTESDGQSFLKEMAIDKVRQQMEQLQRQVVRDVDEKLGIMVDELLREVNTFNLRNYQLRDLFRADSKELLSNRKKSTRSGELPEKEFMARNSLLTDLFEVKHIKTIYHIFLVILIIMFLNTCIHDFVEDGRINFGHRNIIIGFGRFHLALIVWAYMCLSTLSVYPCFCLWARLRKGIKNDEHLLKLWDFSWLIMLIGYQIFFIIIPVKGVLYFDLPPASSVAVLMELVRFLMKSHAFVRSNAPRVLYSRSKKNSEEKPKHSSIVPTFSMFLYYLFCPTLVYRDEYPRSKVIRYKSVFKNFGEVLGVVFYISFIFERFLMPVFREFGDSEITYTKLVLTIFGSVMPATIAFLCGFYCLLHSWMNACAELLRFSDRMFYKDWWNATSFAGYYRTWNIVVHDWLYTYIYKDIYEHVFKGCKPVATLCVFTISAVFHEFILAFTFRFFYPVLFVMFNIFGLLLMFITKKELRNLGNILMWLSLSLGNGLLISLYNIEYYARLKCPVSGDSVLDYVIPVSWSCNSISLNPDWKLKAPWSS